MLPKPDKTGRGEKILEEGKNKRVSLEVELLRRKLDEVVLREARKRRADPERVRTAVLIEGETQCIHSILSFFSGDDECLGEWVMGGEDLGSPFPIIEGEVKIADVYSGMVTVDWGGETGEKGYVITPPKDVRLTFENDKFIVGGEKLSGVIINSSLDDFINGYVYNPILDNKEAFSAILNIQRGFANAGLDIEVMSASGR